MGIGQCSLACSELCREPDQFLTDDRIMNLSEGSCYDRWTTRCANVRTGTPDSTKRVTGWV